MLKGEESGPPSLDLHHIELQDAIVDSRQALRVLLAKAEFADAECMKICATALLNCLHRFPGDKNQIYRSIFLRVHI